MEKSGLLMLGSQAITLIPEDYMAESGPVFKPLLKNKAKLQNKPLSRIQLQRDRYIRPEPDDQINKNHMT